MTKWLNDCDRQLLEELEDIEYEKYIDSSPRTKYKPRWPIYQYILYPSPDYQDRPYSYPGGWHNIPRGTPCQWEW